MKESFELDYYDEIANWSFDEFEIESEDLTNWDLFEELKKVTNKESRVLDLGTGGGAQDRYRSCSENLEERISRFA